MNGVNHELDTRMEECRMLSIIISLQLAMFLYPFWEEVMSTVSGVKSNVLLSLTPMRNTRELSAHPSSDAAENPTSTLFYC